MWPLLLPSISIIGPSKPILILLENEKRKDSVSNSATRNAAVRTPA